MTNAREEYRVSMRARIAGLLDSVMPVAGIGLVLAAVVLVGGGWAQIWMAVAGLLLVEAGVWRLASRLLHERRYLPLRWEVQRFVGMARDLHYKALAVRADGSPESRRELETVVAAMRGSLDRMVAVAGQTESDLEPGLASAVTRSAPAAPPAAGRPVPAEAGAAVAQDPPARG